MCFEISTASGNQKLVNFSILLIKEHLRLGKAFLTNEATKLAQFPKICKKY